jgi:uncharacterized iron-regulated membrane protein
MFVTGVVMWWNRVVRTKLARSSRALPRTETVPLQVP